MISAHSFVESRHFRIGEFYDKSTFHLPRQHLPQSNGRIYIERHGGNPRNFIPI